MDTNEESETLTRDFAWQGPLLDRTRFSLMIKILRARQQQQPPARTAASTDQPQNITQPSSDPCNDSDSDWDSIEPRQLVSEKPAEGLKRRFLDRLAELLAREKLFTLDGGSKSLERNTTSAPNPRSRRSGSQDPGFGHIAAASLSEKDGSATVLVAKNCGLDETDRAMMKRLSQWIQVMAKTGEKDLDKGSTWAEILRYCRARVYFYVDAICRISGAWQLPIERVTAGSLEHKLGDLIGTCRTLRERGSDEYDDKAVSTLACLAYELRSSSVLAALREASLSEPNAKAMQLRIALLGRYRAAYETFKQAAMHFATFKNLSIHGIESIAIGSMGIDLPFVTRSMSTMGIQISTLGPRYSAQSLLRACQLPHSFHAEMQLLFELEKKVQTDQAIKIFPYLGISKKTCFLCAEILAEFPFYRTRGSHRKIYGLWDIPAINNLNPRFLFQFRAALLGTQRKVQVLVEGAFHGSKMKNLPDVAESSAGISSEMGASSVHRRLRHQGKIKQRLVLDRGQDNHDSVSQPNPYDGKELKRVHAAWLPGKGGAPSLVEIPIVPTPTGYHGGDSSSSFIPSFRDYWGLHDLEKSLLIFIAKEQKVGSTNGLYYIYWTGDDRLQPNRCLLELLRDGIPTLPAHRRFWYGDVFIVKLHEDERGCEYDGQGNLNIIDMPDEFLEAPQLMRSIFASLYEHEDLERKLLGDARMLEYNQEWDRAKSLIYQAMTSAEKEMLQMLPYNTIEMLMLTPGKYAHDGFLPTGEIHPCSEDPTKTVIEGYHKPSVLEQMCWEGFSSDQL